MQALDTKGKEYLSDNKRFADLCNVVLFDGEQVINADCLEERDITEVLSVFGVDKKEVQQQKWRDILKNAVIKTDGNVTIVLFGVENQSEIHYAMPIKNLIYDALNYGSQINEAARMHRRNKDTDNSAEFLSGFKKSDRLTPIVTITVYWGTREWDGPLSLHEMFDEKVDSRLLEYISDYKIVLISPNTVKDFSKFRSELGLLLEVIKNSADKKAFRTLVSSDKRFANVDNETVSAINAFTGINIHMDGRKGMTNMCKAVKELREEYIEFGIKQGVESERLSVIQKMICKGYTKEMILDLDYTEEEYAKAEAVKCL